ncbi:MAG: helix-turn-helix domain-containing protein [Clostridia bacterium]
MSGVVSFKNRDRFIQLGIAISTIRKMRGLSQEKLAAPAHVSRSHISAIEAPDIACPFAFIILQMHRRQIFPI